MESTLFPDYLSFEELQDQQYSQRIIVALEKIRLDFLGTNPERRSVVRRLERQNTHDIGSFLRLHRGEVSEWPGVGSVFLTIFDEMREEVHADPEGIVRKWINECAPLSLPRDFNQLRPLEPTANQLFAESEATEVNPLNEDANSCLSAATSEENWFAEIIEIECVFTEIIRLLQARLPDLAEIVRRFYLEGLSPEVIANILHLRSGIVVTQAIEHEFLRPLLNGETLSKLSLDEDFPVRMEILRNLIVPIGEIVVTRRLLRATLTYLQLVPSFVPSAKIAADLLPRLTSSSSGENGGILAEKKRLDALLQNHPWIEQREEGIRLVAEHLQFDYCRIARILADADQSLRKDEILTRYERCYFERPPAVSARLLRKHFPNIQISARGTWSWKT